MNPGILFKYLSPLVNVFETGCLRFSSRRSLNDPFEVLPAVDTFSDFLIRKGLTNESKNELVARFRSHFIEYGDPYIEEGIFNELGMLCLTETPRDILMWSHYAGSHTGYAIGFDATHPFFRQDVYYPFANERPILGKINRVRYVRYRDEAVDTFSDWYLRKADDWMYEKEHRMILPLDQCQRVILKRRDGGCEQVEDNFRIRTMELELLSDPATLCLFRFPAEAVKTVIFGALTDADLVRRILSAAPRSASIEFLRSTISIDRYEIDLERFKRTDNLQKLFVHGAPTADEFTAYHERTLINTLRSVDNSRLVAPGRPTSERAPAADRR